MVCCVLLISVLFDERIPEEKGRCYRFCLHKAYIFVRCKLRVSKERLWDGDTFTGVVEVDHSYSSFGGGTSAGAPSWAGLSALFDQYAGKRLGFLNEALYRILKSRAYLRGFRDITTGNNSVTGHDANDTIIPVAGYDAGPGWDATTGVGTPNVSALAPLLKHYIHAGDGKAL